MMPGDWIPAAAPSSNSHLAGLPHALANKSFGSRVSLKNRNPVSVKFIDTPKSKELCSQSMIWFKAPIDIMFKIFYKRLGPECVTSQNGENPPAINHLYQWHVK